MLLHWDSVCVRVHGPDAQGQKTDGRAFFHNEAGISTLTASGIAFDSGLVITSASLLQPFLQTVHSDSTFQLGPHCGVDVLFDYNIDDDGHEQWIQAQLVAVTEAEGIMSSICRLTGTDSNLWQFGWGNAKPHPGTDISTISRFQIRNVGIAGLVILRLLHPPQSVPTTTLSTSSSSSSSSSSSTLHRQDTSSALPVHHSEYKDDSLHPTIPIAGKQLTLHGSGFGLIAPSVLINNISQGVVANVIHPQRRAVSWQKTLDHTHSLILSDAKFLPGMEGGPVSWGNTGELAGMSMLPIKRTDGEPVDITLVIPIACILSALSPFVIVPGLPLPSEPSDHQHATQSLILAKARRAVVMVQVGQTWASGVLISEHGHILTNAHVFNSFLETSPAPKYSPTAAQAQSSKSSKRQLQRHPQPKLRKGVSLRIRIDGASGDKTQSGHQDQQWIDDCQILYVSESCWDVALIKLPTHAASLLGLCAGSTLPFLPILKASQKAPTHQGSTVFAIGHGIFGPPSGILPLMTSGVCSKMVTFQQEPVMLLSSAPVHRGNSGGVLVNHQGQLVGLVTGNGKTSAGKTITHLNFAVPVEAIADQIHRYFDALEEQYRRKRGRGREEEDWEDVEDTSALEELNFPHPRVDEIWGLRGTAPVWPPLPRL